MKYLKLFENYTKAEVAKICIKYGIKNWTLNSDDTVGVNDDVFLYDKNLTSLPFKFGRVEGSFICGQNNLTSLEGCPIYIGSNFDCYGSILTSLIGCPQYVGRDFHCSNNNIKSFEGIGYIGGNFYCQSNPIWSLWDIFEDTSKIEMFNEWGIIQDDNVILYRLNDFLETIGKREVNEAQLKLIKMNYNVI